MSELMNLELELTGLLYRCKVMDSLQFYQSANSYMQQADLMCQAFTAIVQNEREAYKKWRDKLTRRQQGGLYLAATSLFGLNVTTDTALIIIVRSFVQSMHGFIDSYGQFINRCIFGSLAHPIEEVQPQRVAFWLKRELKSDPTLKDTIDELDEFATSRDYMYLTALSDVLKHHYVVEIKSTMWLNDGTFEGRIRGFWYKGTHYEARDLDDMLFNTHHAMNLFFTRCSKKICNFLSAKKSLHPYTSLRWHDLEFGTVFYEDNGKQKRAFIQYLNVDPDQSPNVFEILSIQEDHNAIPVATNSVANVIVLRDEGGRNHGLVRAIQDLPGKDDVPLIMYRRYKKVALNEFVKQFWDALRSEQKILMTRGQIILFDGETPAHRNENDDE